jgi:hypothetical protein
MPKTTQVDAVTQAAKHGERMLEVRVRFWTNDLADGKGTVWPKHGWSSGMVYMERNASHGIGPSDPLPFNSLMELPGVIERVLIAHKVVLHASSRTKRYVAPPPEGKAPPG